MELEDVVDKLFGTWYHEEFERYDFKTREFKTKDLAFRLYTDHAVVTKSSPRWPMWRYPPAWRNFP